VGVPLILLFIIIFDTNHRTIFTFFIMKQIKRLLIVCAVMCLSSAYGQISFGPSMLIPSGDYYPYVLKPGIGFHLSGEKGDIDDRYRFGVFLDFYTFKATQDTFQTYAVGPSNSNPYGPTYLTPSSEILHHYYVVQMGLSFDFRIIPEGKFSPILGLDFSINAIDISEDDYSIYVSSQSLGGGDVYYNYSLIPRLGAQYQLGDNWLLSAGLGYSLGFGGSLGAQSFWKPYITATYFFR
jgi:hypothetical protein